MPERLRARYSGLQVGVATPEVHRHRPIVVSASPSVRPITHAQPQSVSILLADGHRIFREAIRRLLEGVCDFEVVAEGAGGSEVVRLALALEPQVLLLDLDRSHGGLDVLRQLRTRSRTHVLLLADSLDDRDLLLALQLGARGVVLKDSESGVLFNAIRGVAGGEYWVGRESVADLPRALQRTLPNPDRVERKNFDLTDREREVVAAVVAAYRNKEIAQTLSVSEKTIKRHLTNIFDKLGVSSRVELTLFALHHSDLELPPL